jgi:hypothetical protein
VPRHTEQVVRTGAALADEAEDLEGKERQLSVD